MFTLSSKLTSPPTDPPVPPQASDSQASGAVSAPRPKASTILATLEGVYGAYLLFIAIEAFQYVAVGHVVRLVILGAILGGLAAISFSLAFALWTGKSWVMRLSIIGIVAYIGVVLLVRALPLPFIIGMVLCFAIMSSIRRQRMKASVVSASRPNAV